MVLRIRGHEGSDSGVWLEGRLVAEWAALLESECSALFKSRDEVSLDRAGVSFVDLAGIEVLQRLNRAGAQILCPPGPVASVLEGVGVPIKLDAESAGDGRL